jgi:uncharacterized protein YxeA
MKKILILLLSISLFSCTKVIFVYHPAYKKDEPYKEYLLNVDTLGIAGRKTFQDFNHYQMPEYKFPELKNTLLFEGNFKFNRDSNFIFSKDSTIYLIKN